MAETTRSAYPDGKRPVPGRSGGVAAKYAAAAVMSERKPLADGGEGVLRRAKPVGVPSKSAAPAKRDGKRSLNRQAVSLMEMAAPAQKKAEAAVSFDALSAMPSFAAAPAYTMPSAADVTPDASEAIEDIIPKRDFPPKIRRKGKFNASNFIIIALVFLISMALLVAVSSSLRGLNASSFRPAPSANPSAPVISESPEPTESAEPSETVESEDAESADESESLPLAASGDVISHSGVVLTNFAESEKLEIYDFASAKSYVLFVGAETEMADRFGKPMTFAEFGADTIVDVSYLREDYTLLKLSASADRFDIKETDNAVVYTEQDMMKLGGKLYSYNHMTDARHMGDTVDPDTIDRADVISIRGYGEFITAIEIVKSHGTLEIAANNLIVDGFAEVDTTQTLSLRDNVAVTLTEGRHRVAIKGRNIEPMVEEFMIEKDETYTIDTNHVAFTSGFLTVGSTLEGAQLKINGTLRPLNSSMLLPFADYTIEVTCEGYEPNVQTVALNSSEMAVDVILTEIIVETPQPRESAEPRSERVAVEEVSVSTTPEGAHVYMDNVYQGQTPLKFDAEPGEHQLSIRSAEYTDLSFPIIVTEDGIAPIDVELQPMVNGQ